MQVLHLKTLGEFALSLDGGEISAPTRKAGALLVYLALSPGGTRSREHLAGIFWGRSAEQQARASLRQTLSSLRKQFAEPFDLIAADAEKVSIRQAHLQVDALEFDSLSNSQELADLQCAAEIYQGDFLQGFSLREEGFEDWLSFARQQYRESAMRVLARLDELHAARGDFDACLRHVQRLLALDPTREQSHLRLMQIYSRLERREDALRQYDECQSILDAELGVAPGDELVALRQAIRTGALPSAETGGERFDTAGCLSLKPSIAVLPFDNLSGEPSQQFLADGITRDLVSNLAHDLWFDVIAYTSTEQYRDNKAGIADIATRLGARYVVDGSLRRAGDRVRVSVVLIDGSDAHQIWSRQYDSVDSDIFELQDQVALSIAAEVLPELGVAEQQSAIRQHPQNMDAWSYCHKAFWHLYKFELDELSRARDLFEKAIGCDRSYSQPYAGLAYGQMMTVWYDSTKKALLEDAEENARKAVSLNNRDSFAHFALGRVLSMLTRYDEAIFELETAIELNPSFGRAYFGLASVRAYSGQFERVLEPVDTAIRLSPADPHLWTFYNIKSRALTGLGRYEEALHWSRLAVRQPSSTFWSDVALISALGYLGDAEGARAAIDELQRKKPGYTCEQYRRDDFMLTDESHEMVAAGLRRAGLPQS